MEPTSENEKETLAGFGNLFAEVGFAIDSLAFALACQRSVNPRLLERQLRQEAARHKARSKDVSAALLNQMIRSAQIAAKSRAKLGARFRWKKS